MTILHLLDLGPVRIAVALIAAGIVLRVASRRKGGRP